MCDVVFRNFSELERALVVEAKDAVLSSSLHECIYLLSTVTGRSNHPQMASPILFAVEYPIALPFSLFLRGVPYEGALNLFSRESLVLLLFIQS